MEAIDRQVQATADEVSRAQTTRAALLDALLNHKIDVALAEVLDDLVCLGPQAEPQQPISRWLLGLLATPAVKLVDLGGVLDAKDPAKAFDDADLMTKRRVIDFFMTVTLHPHPRGKKTLDSAAVEIVPKSQPGLTRP
ncbi:hypothetical protein [Micrococcus luteus]|uniref:hypothetical protein n=1 Tax=Micrococcus luteus TaxID=1270 RepID=UPI003D759987